MTIALLENVTVKCDNCGRKTEILKEDFELYTDVRSHHDDGMGDELECCYSSYIKCYCGNSISIRLSGYEYPIGAFNCVIPNIYGGDFQKIPEMGIIYDGLLLYEAPNEIDRIKNLILSIANNPNKIYDLTPRKFEELIERLLQEQGYETILTPPTRDGGKDIIATKYIMGQPFVIYVECKRYGKKSYVDVKTVRALFGVQTAEKVNKSIIYTTGRVSPEAREFVEKQKTMMSIVSYKEIIDLIKKSARQYNVDNPKYGKVDSDYFFNMQ